MNALSQRSMHTMMALGARSARNSVDFPSQEPSSTMH
jgi:hypothetical protein